MISDDAVKETCDEASKGYWGQGAGCDDAR